MKKWMFWLFMPLSLMAASEPLEVARAFWQAMQQGHTETAKEMTVRGHIESALPLHPEILGVEVREGNVSEGRALLPTRLILRLPVKKGGKGLVCEARFATELLDVAGKWRVDGIVTMEHYDDGVTVAAVECGSRLFDEAVRKGMRYFERLGRMLEENDEELRDFMEKWRREMERMMQELQRTPPVAPPPGREPIPLPPPEKGEKI